MNRNETNIYKNIFNQRIQNKIKFFIISLLLYHIALLEDRRRHTSRRKLKRMSENNRKRKMKLTMPEICRSDKRVPFPNLGRRKNKEKEGAGASFSRLEPTPVNGISWPDPV